MGLVGQAGNLIFLGCHTVSHRSPPTNQPIEPASGGPWVTSAAQEKWHTEAAHDGSLRRHGAEQRVMRVPSTSFTSSTATPVLNLIVVIH